MHIAYTPQIDTDRLILSEEESNHCVKVLRKKQGNTLWLTDGRGICAHAQIINAHHKKCEVELLQKELVPPDFSYQLHLVIAPPKHTERLDWLIEKACETGVSSISFIETKYAERTRINYERCKKIAISAMKQSKQWYLPQIHELEIFEASVSNIHTELKMIAWCKADKHIQIRTILATQPQAKDITIVIGPEGDFDAAEIAFASNQGFTPISLGKTILRTETAALFACMALRTLRA
jgi:16S rRNA (uracil1498-N3)-methyltransferase